MYYEDVVEEVVDFLNYCILECMFVGILKEYIILDVGFGFGKIVEYNY